MVAQRTIVLLVVLATVLASLVLLYLYHSSVGSQSTSAHPGSSAISASSKPSPTSFNGVGFFSKFFLNLTRFYASRQGTEYVSIADSFCRALLLGRIVNSTHILVNGTLYSYGVLAYKPMGGDYDITDRLIIGNRVHIAHIQPKKNITVIGGFGKPIWFELSVNGESRVYWNTEYPGIVYENEKLICTHSTIRVGGETIHIVRLFLVKHGVGGGVGVASTWLALLATGGN